MSFNEKSKPLSANVCHCANGNLVNTKRFSGAVGATLFCQIDVNCWAFSIVAASNIFVWWVLSFAVWVIVATVLKSFSTIASLKAWYCVEVWYLYSFECKNCQLWTCTGSISWRVSRVSKPCCASSVSNSLSAWERVFIASSELIRWSIVSHSGVIFLACCFCLS